jgi:hypothetical protein
MKRMKSILEGEHNFLCDYGCNNKANYILSNNKKCCKSNPVNCPAVCTTQNRIISKALKISQSGVCSYCTKNIPKSMLKLHENVCIKNPNAPLSYCKTCNAIIFNSANPQLYAAPSTHRKFCNKRCAAIYNNAHKTTGVRISRGEAKLFLTLQKRYPTLTIINSDRKQLDGLELDIFIKEIKLGIEYNGVCHYTPIYGEKRFEEGRRKDAKKVTLCQEKGIHFLVVMDKAKFEKVFKQSTELIEELCTEQNIILDINTVNYIPTIEEIVKITRGVSPEDYTIIRKMRKDNKKNIPLLETDICYRGCGLKAITRTITSQPVCSKNPAQCPISKQHMHKKHKPHKRPKHTT